MDCSDSEHNYTASNSDPCWSTSHEGRHDDGERWFYLNRSSRVFGRQILDSVVLTNTYTAPFCTAVCYVPFVVEDTKMG